jgi:hypothetical protein
MNGNVKVTMELERLTIDPARTNPRCGGTEYDASEELPTPKMGEAHGFDASAMRIVKYLMWRYGNIDRRRPA